MHFLLKGVTAADESLSRGLRAFFCFAYPFRRKQNLCSFRHSFPSPQVWPGQRYSPPPHSPKEVVHPSLSSAPIPLGPSIPRFTSWCTLS
ncbi:hypothetical protein AVEN_108931-1 [Araneus ventricosus]|uniref:Uncharacterized protein n=1 Tax=Araneus ventricosus TaxID=182803 RepID=A0A4Y2ER93_ARAVE|nr:hypothetical protein AVEN_108931-1 [Araneus ventricosus]